MSAPFSVGKVIILLWLSALFSGTVLAGEKVTLATTNWAPYYAQSLPHGGPLVEVTREAFKRVGYDIKMSWLPWKRALSKVNKGGFSAIVGAYKTLEREELLLFNEEPLGYVENGIFLIDQASVNYSKVTELKNTSICLATGTSISPEFDSASYLKKHVTHSQVTCIELLLKKRVEAIAGDEVVLKALLKERNNKWQLKSVFNTKSTDGVVSGIFALDQSILSNPKLTDLKDVSICFLRGSSIFPEFDQADYLKKQVANSEAGCVELLLKKRVDAIAGSRFVFNVLLKQHNEQFKLKPLIIFDKRALFHAFSKKKANYQTVQADFDKGMRLIKQDKTYDQIMKKHGFHTD